MKVKIDVSGDDKVARNMEAIGKALDGAEMRDTMRDATMMLTTEAQLNLVGYQSSGVGGVDTGNLRSRISPGVEHTIYGWLGRVGTNVPYAPFVEYDTSPHFPPLSALEGWARRHGTSAWLVAKGIARHGTKGKHFLGKATKENRQRVYDMFEKTVRLVVVRYG